MAYFIGKTEDNQDIYGVDFDIEVKDTKQADDGKRTVSLIGSTPSVDRDGDTINQSGWELSAFRNNPAVQWAHDHSIPNIGRANKFVKSKEALDFREIEFPKTGIHPFADMIFSLMKEGFIKMGSVGFIPIKSERRKLEENEAGGGSPFFIPTNFIKQELLEFSIVNVGSNRDALAYLTGKGFKGNDVNKLFESMVSQDKRVIPYRKYPLDDEGAAWNGPKEVAAANVGALARISTWVDAENADAKSGYKLPHHRAEGLNTVWRGVRAAMGALLGARGGVDIPEGDRKGVYNHLVKHYQEFTKEPPEFKVYTEHDSIAELSFLDVDECAECGVTIGVEPGEKWAQAGKSPLCKGCFDKANDDIVSASESVCMACKKNFKVYDVLTLKYAETDIDDRYLCYECNEKEALVKAGAVLNRANKKKLRDAARLVSEVLASSEPAEEDGKDITDDNHKLPDEVKSEGGIFGSVEAIEELELLMNDFFDKRQRAHATDEFDLDETKVPDEINLKEMELPDTSEKDAEEIDFNMISKALEEIRKKQLADIKVAIKEELRNATGVVD